LLTCFSDVVHIYILEKHLTEKPVRFLDNSLPYTIAAIKIWAQIIFTYNKAIKEISIFSNGCHLEWRAGLMDTILKGNHPRTTPDHFGLIWFQWRRFQYDFYQNLPKLRNQYTIEQVKDTFHRKSRKMCYTTCCHVPTVKKLRSFWLIIKQQ
jgi:hypothetical protein